jgi:uncharacterized phage protein (TIGR02220 family)
MDDEGIELAAGWKGEPGRFMKAVMDEKINFLEKAPEGGVYQLHDWRDHNPWSAGAKARSRKARRAALIRHGYTEEEIDRMLNSATSMQKPEPGRVFRKQEPVACVEHNSSHAPCIASSAAGSAECTKNPAPFPSPSPSPKPTEHAASYAVPSGKAQVFASVAGSVIEYLNMAADTKFKPDIQVLRRLILTRLGEGFSVDELKLVIDYAVQKCGGRGHLLRPGVLFGAKFKQFVDAAKVLKAEGKLIGGAGKFAALTRKEEKHA